MSNASSASRDILDRIGGPSAVTVRGILLLFIPSLLPTIVYDSGVSGGSPLAWGLVGAAGTCAGAIPYLLLGRWLLPSRPRRPRPLTAVAVFATAGITRGLTIGLLSVATGLASDPQFAFRVTGGAALGICWFALTAIIIDAWSRHRDVERDLEDRQSLAASQRALAEADLRESRDRIRDTLLTQVTSILALLAAAAQKGTDAEGVRHIAQTMHTTVTDVVRPLSHSLAHGDMSPTPRHRPVSVRTRDWLRLIAIDALTVDPYHPVITALVIMPSALPASVTLYGPLPGVAGALGIGTIAWAMLTLGRRFHARRPVAASSWSWIPAVAAYALVGAACAAVPVAFSVLFDGSIAEGWRAGGQVLFILTPIAALGAAVIAAEDRRRTVAEREREATVAVAEWSTRRIQQESWAASHRIARELHGGVQSELTASALRLEWWATQHDTETLPSVLAQVTAVVDRVNLLLDTERRPTLTDPLEALAAVASVWQGIASVQLDLSDDACAMLTHDAAATESLVEVFRESLGNAVRHGRATRVQAAVRLAEPAVISVRVEDNGRGLPATPVPGLGSRLLDDVCLSWERRTITSGTLLAARLPVAIADAPGPSTEMRSA